MGILVKSNRLRLKQSKGEFCDETAAVLVLNGKRTPHGDYNVHHDDRLKLFAQTLMRAHDVSFKN